MAEVFLAGIGILLTLLSWHFSVVPALRGRARDRLEGLLEEVQAFQRASVQHRRDPAVRALLRLIESHRLSIGRMNLFGHTAAYHWTTNEPQASEMFRSDFEARFATDNKDTQAFIDSVRARGFEALMESMAQEQFIVWVIAFITFPFFALAKGIHTLHAIVPRVALKLAGKKQSASYRVLLEEESMQLCIT